MKQLTSIVLVSSLAMGLPAFAQDSSVSKPAAASPAGAPTTATSEGTVKLFIEAMKQGDFARVVELADSGSEAYEDLQKMADAFDPEKKNPNIDDQMFAVIKGFFTNSWKDVEVKQVVEQVPRAQYELTFFYVDEKTKKRTQGEKRTMDLNQFEGAWRVLVSSTLMKPAVPTAVGGAPVAPPAPATSTPMPKPPEGSPSAPPAKEPAKPQ